MKYHFDILNTNLKLHDFKDSLSYKNQFTYEIPNWADFFLLVRRIKKYVFDLFTINCILSINYSLRSRICCHWFPQNKYYG